METICASILSTKYMSLVVTITYHWCCFQVRLIQSHLENEAISKTAYLTATSFAQLAQHLGESYVILGDLAAAPDASEFGAFNIVIATNKQVSNY